MESVRQLKNDDQNHTEKMPKSHVHSKYLVQSSETTKKKLGYIFFNSIFVSLYVDTPIPRFVALLNVVKIEFIIL